MDNRLEDLFYLGRGVEIVPWLTRRDAKALRAMEPLESSLYATAIQRHPWDRNGDFRDVYITMTYLGATMSRETTTTTAVVPVTTVIPHILLVFPALPHALDYLRVPPHLFPDAALLENMYQTLQLRAIRCVTDDWVLCDVFRVDGTTRSMHCKRGPGCTRSADCDPTNEGRTERPGQIPIGTTVYLPHRYELTLWHERPPFMPFTHKQPSFTINTRVVVMSYASRVDQMIPLVRGQMSAFSTF